MHPGQLVMRPPTLQGQWGDHVGDHVPDFHSRLAVRKRPSAPAGTLSERPTDSLSERQNLHSLQQEGGHPPRGGSGDVRGTGTLILTQQEGEALASIRCQQRGT